MLGDDGEGYAGYGHEDYENGSYGGFGGTDTHTRGYGGGYFGGLAASAAIYFPSTESATEKLA